MRGTLPIGVFCHLGYPAKDFGYIAEREMDMWTYPYIPKIKRNHSKISHHWARRLQDLFTKKRIWIFSRIHTEKRTALGVEACIEGSNNYSRNARVGHKECSKKDH